MNMFNIVNEDGTSLDDMPINPLKEKWDKLYPPIPKPEYSTICDGYSCSYCGICPNGSLWVVPEEDKQVWDEYQRKLSDYNREHNPSMYK